MASPIDLDEGEACSFFVLFQTLQGKTSGGTDHHTITANVLGGNSSRCPQGGLGFPSTNPVTAAREGLRASREHSQRLHKGRQRPSGYKVALEEFGMQESENSLFGRAANETTQILTLRHSFSRLFSTVAEQKARARDVQPR